MADEDGEVYINILEWERDASLENDYMNGRSWLEYLRSAELMDRGLRP